MRPAQRSAVLSGGAVTPRSILGSALVGWWNADSGAKITTTGAGGVTSWLDEIGGYDLSQATDAARPVWSPTSFNSRGGVTFDGVDDFLRLASTPGTFPVGASTSEIWVLADQAVDKAVATSLTAFGYGSGSTNTRLLRRTVATSENRASLNAQGSSANNTAGIWFGRHVVRGVFADASIVAYLDGVAGTVGTPALATIAGNVTMGATTAASPAGFFGGNIHQAMVISAPPTAQQLTALYSYFNVRI